MSVTVLDPVVLSGWARCSARRFFLRALVTLLFLVQAGCSRTQPASVRGDAANPIAVRSFPVEEERSEEHTSELQSRQYLVCRLLLEKKKKKKKTKERTI